MRKTMGDRVFDNVILLIMLLVACVTLYPFLHILAVSLNEARDASRGGIGIIPRKLSIASYRTVFGYSGLYNAFLISTARTICGTFIFLVVTMLCGYAMTKKQLKGYKVIYLYFVVSMLVGGGLVPVFLLFQRIRIYNTFLVYVLPGAFSAYYMILFRTFIIQLPQEMEEAALIDGANEWSVFFKIIIPLSTPIIATIGLFVAVGQWNAWQDTLYFTTDSRLETLQYVLMKVLRQAEGTRITRLARASMAQRMGTTNITPDSIKMAITIVATIPIICVYPFLQKYFVKGIVIGAVKG